jgi:uncharacterized lipoprotein YmbA
MGCSRLGVSAVVALVLGACAPVTLENTGAVDFERYRTVWVAPLEGDGSPNDRDYLIDELRAASGFARVTTDPDETVAADLVVTLDEDRGVTAGDYTVYVRWELSEPDGTLIDRGSSDVTEEDAFEAVEEALDEVVVHYLRPYRI